MTPQSRIDESITILKMHQKILIRIIFHVDENMLVGLKPLHISHFQIQYRENVRDSRFFQGTWIFSIECTKTTDVEFGGDSRYAVERGNGFEIVAQLGEFPESRHACGECRYQYDRYQAVEKNREAERKYVNVS